MKWTIALSLLFVGLIFAGFISYWTGDFSAGGLRGMSFDSLGAHLPNLDASIDEEAIGWEAFKVNGKLYMYQGPFPALLRMPFNKLFPEMYGKWSQPSCLLGSFLAVLAFALSLCMPKERNDIFSNRNNKFAKMILILAFALGTPLIYLVSSSRIYHEAIIWGLCGSLWAIFSLLCYLRTTRSHTFFLCLYAFATAVALLSRITFGLPLLIIFGFLMLSRLFGKKSPESGQDSKLPRRLVTCVVVALPVLAAIGLQLWYNEARFGSIFKAIDYKYFYHNPADNGGEFNFERLSSSFLNYFGFRSAYFSNLPPYIFIASVLYYTPTLFFDWHEQTTSLSVCAPWLVLGAVFGVLVTLKRKWSYAFLYILPFVAQAGVILMYDFVTQRYTSEFVPFLSISFLLFLELYGALQKFVVRLFLYVICAFSMFASLGTALSWQMMYAGTDDVSEVFSTKLKNLFLPQFSVPAWEGKRVNVESLKPLKVDVGFIDPQINKAFDGGDLKILNTPYSHGIGIHAPVTMTYAVPQGAEALQMAIGMANTALGCALVAFEVRVVDENNQQLYTSGVMGLAAAPIGEGTRVPKTTFPQVARIPLKNSKAISIIVDDLGSRDCDHVNIGDPEFLLRS